MSLLGARVGTEDVMWGRVRELSEEGAQGADEGSPVLGGRENGRGRRAASSLALSPQAVPALRVTCKHFKWRPPSTSCLSLSLGHISTKKLQP